MTITTELKLDLPSRVRLVDDVCRVLEDSILTGKIAPGERLTEAWIAQQLGVSRTTVREALLMLERQGLVVSKPRRGTFVTRLSPEEAFDLGRTRSLLEGYAVRAGYSRLTPALLKQLEALIEQMRACTLPDDAPKLMQIDVAFHRMLAELSGSPRLVELWSSLNGQIRALFLTTIERQHADISYVVAFHRELLDDLCVGDPMVAQRAIIRHYVREIDAVQLDQISETVDILTLSAPLRS